MPRNHRSARNAGTAAERAIANYLANTLGDDRIDRRPRTGAKDRGDIGGLRAHNQRLTIEVKNTTRITLPAWIREAHQEATNDNALTGIVIHKRQGTTNPADWWTTMTVADLIALITGTHPNNK